MTDTNEVVLVSAHGVELVILPALGARVHSLRVHGRELLRTPADVTMHEREPFFWGAYTMAPWANRITPGRSDVGGRTVALPANFEDGSAIHGQVYGAAFQRTADGTFSVEAGGDGWPWRYRVELEYSVAPGPVVRITQRLRNIDDVAMPGGIGLHPWFPTPVEARVNSSLTYGNAKASTTQPQPVTGNLDLRVRGVIAEGVDATWAEPAEPAYELWWPDGLHAAVRAPFPTLHVVAAYAPERGAIAVEPETNAPQGLRRLLNGEPGGLVWIEPGQQIVLPIDMIFEIPA